MSWRWVFVRARLVPLTVSLLVVVVVNEIVPGLLIAWLLGSLAAAMVAMRSGVWRFGTRRPMTAESQMIRAALGMVSGQRGRNERTLWMFGSAELQVALPRRRDIVVSTAWVRAIDAGALSVENLAASIAEAVGRSVIRRTWVKVVDAACCPAWVVAMPFTWVLRRTRIAGLLQAWLVLIAVPAVVQQAWAGRWSVAASVACLAAVVSWALRWSRRWRLALSRLGSDAVRAADLTEHHLQDVG